MCRFLLVKSKQPIFLKPILNSFSQMAKNSRAFDGDWQGDGWGVSWLKNGRRQVYKSLKPVWEDEASFVKIPASTTFAIHARSATFPQHKNNIEFNQPYINTQYGFVFNGYLKGVTLSVPGKIGAEKIWFLVKKTLNDKKPVEALEKVKNLLKKNTREIQASNIGLTDGKNIYALCFYNKHADYYRLHYYQSSEISLISSEKINGFSFYTLKSNQTIAL